MISVIISNFFIGSLYLITGIFIYIQAKKEISHRLFFLFCIISSITILLDFISQTLYYYKIYFYYLDSLKFIPFIISIITANVFILHFPEKKKLINIEYLLLLYLPVLYICIVTISGNFFHITFSPFKKKSTIHYFILAIISLFHMAAGISILARKYFRIKNKVQKNQIKIFFIGSLVGFSFVAFLGLFPRSLNLLRGISGFQIGSAIFLISIAYSLAKYRLFDIRTAIQYTLFNLLSLFILFTPVTFIPFLFDLKQEITYLLIIYGNLTVIYLIILNYSLIPIINKISLRQRKQYDLEFDNVSEKMNNFTDIKDIQSLIFNSININIYTTDLILLTLNNNYFYGHSEISKKHFKIKNEEFNWLMILKK